MRTSVASILLSCLAGSSLSQNFAVKPYALNGDNGPNSEEYSQQIADEFTSGASGNVARVRIWGNYSGQGDPYDSGSSHSFRIRFFEDAGGSPALMSFFDEYVDMELMDTGISQEGDRIYRFDGNISGPYLSLGTVYYFQALEADPTTSLGLFRWNNAADDGSAVFWRWNDSETWSTDRITRANSAFVLFPAPEPASAAVLGLGFLVLSRRRS